MEITIDLVRCRVASWFKAKWHHSCDSVMDLAMNPSACVPPSKIVRVRPTTIWEKSLLGSLKFNVDGSSLGNPRPSGIGGLLRDHMGRELITFSKSIGVSDSNIVEVMTVRESLVLFDMSP
ncbi:hypothetical protein PTKIN_Ptkin16aG0010000 [Pterospermum kingtungense]